MGPYRVISAFPSFDVALEVTDLAARARYGAVRYSTTRYGTGPARYGRDSAQRELSTAPYRAAAQRATMQPTYTYLIDIAHIALVSVDSNASPRGCQLHLIRKFVTK